MLFLLLLKLTPLDNHFLNFSVPSNVSPFWLIKKKKKASLWLISLLHQKQITGRQEKGSALQGLQC